MGVLVAILLLMIPAVVLGEQSVFKVKPKETWYSVPSEADDAGDTIYQMQNIKRWKPKIKMRWGDHKISLRGKRNKIEIKYKYYFELF